MNAPIVFMDTETTGLAFDDDIWEFAAIRREPDGAETALHLFIEHDYSKCKRLPDPFRDDHNNRYLIHKAVSRREAACEIDALFDDRPHVVGAVPNFDTERVRLMLAREWPRWPVHGRWHYHLIDVENLAVGYLFGAYRHNPISSTLGRGKEATVALPWDSDLLSKQVGVDPARFERHTAMGDVRWAMAIYDAVTKGGAS